MLFKLLILVLAFLGLAFAQTEVEPQADDIVYGPHGILHTNTLHYFFTAGRCSNKFKFRRNFLKTMILGYHSFKQDNDNERGALRTVFLDTNYLTTGDRTPKPMVYGKWYSWFSNEPCSLANPTPCGFPGVCSGSPTADMIINLLSAIFGAISNPKSGYFCAGSHGEDSLYDCCSGVLGDGGVYKLVRSGWSMRKRDGSGDAHEMPFLYVNRDNKKLIIECKGDDIWFQDWRDDESFTVFSPYTINGDEWYYRSPGGKDYTNTRDIFVAIREGNENPYTGTCDKSALADDLWDVSKSQKVLGGRY